MRPLATSLAGSRPLATNILSGAEADSPIAACGSIDRISKSFRQYMVNTKLSGDRIQKVTNARAIASTAAKTAIDRMLICRRPVQYAMNVIGNQMHDDNAAQSSNAHGYSIRSIAPLSRKRARRGFANRCVELRLICSWPACPRCFNTCLWE
jgi:hypothetical protein